MFWFYIPLAITFLTALFYIFLNTSQDRSGAGMMGFFLLVPLGMLNLVTWMAYFAAGMFFGIR